LYLKGGVEMDVDELIESHWEYIEALLTAHGVKEIEIIKFHYMSAFEHGFKHGVEARDEQP
jgi:hypothetical protein